MSTNRTSSEASTTCRNCGLGCRSMFCCDWCMDAYLARRDAGRERCVRLEASQPGAANPPGRESSARMAS